MCFDGLFPGLLLLLQAERGDRLHRDHHQLLLIGF
jgi:hypothetical protein